MSVFAAALSLCLTAAQPLRLLPANPHYFEFRGKPTVLVTSGEHYGAVLNLDFDHAPYLNELQARGLNLTRLFSGTYREVPGSFNIKDNTLAPKEGRYAAPWARKGGKYDLDAFDDDSLRRLKSFVSMAAGRGIVVEFVLFCPFYEENLWAVNPMNARNNVNGIGDCPREEVYTLKHPKLLDRQLAFTRRVVAELNEYDNVYFEICNEPYFGGVTLDWQKRIAEEITATEKGLPNKHLIAQNIANGSAKIEKPDPNVSIFNFHYASPPTAVAENRRLEKPIGFDETGFKGTGDAVYRREAWEFLLSGGAVFSHLDYSFSPDHPDGTAKVVDPTPGGGGREFRLQLAVLKKLLDGLDLGKTLPTGARIKAADGSLTPAVGLFDEGAGVHVLYAAKGPRAAFAVPLVAGAYQVEWIEPATGAIVKTDAVDVRGGVETIIRSPDAREDVAARVSRLAAK